MALEQKLALRLSQKLVMTPSLQQAIKLLQMTRMELQTVLTQELVENPVLEEADDPQAEEEPEAEETEADEFDLDAMSDVDLDSYFNDYLEGSTTASTYEHMEATPIDATLVREPDLYDHLLWQLHLDDVPERLRTIAELVVGNVDPDGFLVATREEIRAMGDGIEGEEPFSDAEVDEAIALVQSLDPAGIACFDLRESLLKQLDAEDQPEDSVARRLVADHWEAFLKRQFPQIAKRIGLELAALEPAVDRIKGLETRPGRKFSSDRTHYVEPDVHVVKVGGEYVIQLNDDGMPKLRLSKAYRRMFRELRAEGAKDEARQFLKEKFRAALWLIKSIDQRQRTIYKVADSIVRQQREFLDRGIDHLRPMVLRDVADDIGMHESTVSRVVSNKYIHTPRGLCPMKFFFHSGLDREFGEDISSLSVKRKIEQLIEEEDPTRPLSDSALMAALKREGINIARRTVAKYRDELGIGSSTQRKKIF